MAVARDRMSAMLRFCLPRCTAFNRFGMAMAARMPMIAMTISNSMRVKPDWFFFILFPPILGTSPQVRGQEVRMANRLFSVAWIASSMAGTHECHSGMVTTDTICRGSSGPTLYRERERGIKEKRPRAIGAVFESVVARRFLELSAFRPLD